MVKPGLQIEILCKDTKKIAHLQIFTHLMCDFFKTLPRDFVSILGAYRGLC